MLTDRPRAEITGAEGRTLGGTFGFDPSLADSVFRLVAV